MAHAPASKRQTLHDTGTLNRRPEGVTDPLFLEHEFFDAYDLLQVKYEMLRRVQTEGWSVTQAAQRFGFSRLSLYHALSAFEREGLGGLVAKKRGPKSAHKLSHEVMAFVEHLLEEDPGLNARTLAQRIEQRFAMSVHPRSVERALKRRKKKLSSMA